MHRSEAEKLQQQMNLIRHDLDGDFQVITERLHEFGEWRSYVKTHPYFCLGTAAILGYLIVPGRYKKWSSRGSLAVQRLQSDEIPASTSMRSQRSTREVAVSFLGAAILQGLSSYIGNRVRETLESFQENTLHENNKKD